MGSSVEGRADRLAHSLAGSEIDSILVGDLVRPGDSAREAIADLTWLTGFRGTSGLALVSERERLFITDFRYIERARAELPEGFDLLRAERSLIDAVGPRLAGRVGFDPSATSVRELRRLEEAAADGVELLEREGLIEGLRRIKDDAEIASIAAAAELTDRIYEELEEQGLEGRTEREVGLWIERRMRELHADGPAFAPIVAAGPNGSLPHAEPSQRPIGAGELVVVDLGVVLEGYCSDCTRTYAAGAPEEEAEEVYGVVLAAQLAALDGTKAGAGGREVDGIAREVIAEAGYGDYFGHGLGHGVGIAVHEAPRLSQRSDDTLERGDVVTIEPGVYLPGRFGVRIEDLVVVEGDGNRNLSGRPKDLLQVG